MILSIAFCVIFSPTYYTVLGLCVSYAPPKLRVKLAYTLINELSIITAESNTKT